MDFDSIEDEVAETKSTGNAESEASKGELAKVKELKKWISYARSTMGGYEADIKRNRRYVYGNTSKSGGESTDYVANIINARVSKSVNRSYARNPELSIVPSDAVSPGEYKMWRQFGKVAEIVINSILKNALFKRKAKACLRACKTSRVGWLKVILQKDHATDPIVKERMQDIQDNIAMLEVERRKIDDPLERENIDLSKQNYQEILDSISKDAQIRVANGFTITQVLPENLVFDLNEVQSFDGYENATRIAERTEYPLDKAKALFPDADFKDAKLYKSKVETKGGDDEALCQSVHIWEVWDSVTLKCYNIADGLDDYLRPPYTPDAVGERWFPYFGLATNIVDGRFMPLSDVDLLRPLQDEHTKARKRYSDLRDKYRFNYIADGDGWTVEDIKRFNESGDFEIVRIQGSGDERSVDKQITVAVQPQLNPVIYDTSHVEHDADMITGGGEITNPGNNASKTLGEAQNLAQDASNDSSADTDEIEDWFYSIAVYILEIVLQAYSVEKIVEIAGEDAGPVWPTMPREQVFNLVRVTVLPGSSGKPDKSREQRLMAEIMPVLTESIMQIAELKKNNDEEMAETMKLLVQEMMRMSEYRFDLDEFFPKPDEEEEIQKEEEERQIAQEQQQQMQISLEQVIADIKKTESEAQLNKARIEEILSKIESMQANDLMTMAGQEHERNTAKDTE